MRVPRTLGAYGVTLVLGLFGATGFVKQCAPAAAPAPAPPALTRLDYSAECVRMVNAERAARGIGPVTVDLKLTYAAETHSRYQASISTMTHLSANGTNGGVRLHNVGYSWSTYGENVAAGQANCTLVMGAWMNSAGHKANILNARFVHIGIGAISNAKGVVYWTMDLAAPL